MKCKRLRLRNIAVPCLVYFVLVGISSPLVGQSLSPDLDKVSKAVEKHLLQKRPEWKHQTVPPVTPPGSQPSPDVVIHFWSSEKCLTAEDIIDGVSAGKHSMSCHIKLAIDQSQSASAAYTRLSDFVRTERSASPILVGDKGYIWRGSDVVFIKDKFTFWLSGDVGLRVGDLTNYRQFVEKLAKEIADSVSDN